MQLLSFPFQTLDWQTIEPVIHKGETGFAIWKVFMMNTTRIRLVEYSPGYLADHWCTKGHIIYCIKGQMETTLEDGRSYLLKTGMNYFVGDHNEPHQSKTTEGCTLFIVD
ncbi:MAG: DHCW motif cupin fold protein [Ferruginibacter sp.]